MSAKTKEIAVFMLTALAGFVLYRRSTGAGFTFDPTDASGLLDELQAGLTGQFFADLAGGGLKLSAWQTPAAGQQFEAWFKQASADYRLPAGLLSRMAYQESRYNPNAVSPVGATGIMQLMPVHWSQVDPKDPRASIFYAAKYMAGHFQKFGSWDKALAAYNWGQGNLGKLLATNSADWLTKVPRETYHYVTEIGRDTGLVYFGTKPQGVA